jgi:hypothetical protein
MLEFARLSKCSCSHYDIEHELIFSEEGHVPVNAGECRACGCRGLVHSINPSRTVLTSSDEEPVFLNDDPYIMKVPAQVIAGVPNDTLQTLIDNPNLHTFVTQVVLGSRISYYNSLMQDGMKERPIDREFVIECCDHIIRDLGHVRAITASHGWRGEWLYYKSIVLTHLIRFTQKLLRKKP